MSTPDVIVVGGGPAGSSSALALARAGARVLLFDRARFPRDKPCAEYLSPESSRVLEAMGALEACERAGAAQLAGMVVRAPSGDEIRGDFVAAHGWRGFRDRGLALPRRILDAILLDRARDSGVDVTEGERVVDLLRDAHGSVCGVETLGAHGERIAHRARLVIGADGLRSIVARRLGVQHQSRFPRRLAVVAHYRGVSGVGTHGEMHVERDGYLGIADVGGGLANVAVVVPIASARQGTGNPSALLDGWIARHPHITPRFAGAERVSEARATGPFASRARRAWASGAALVGDAADFFDPFTGEGIYAALRGGELLAPHAMTHLGAASSQAADGALADYDRARRAAFAGKWRVERLIGLAVAFPSLMNIAARSLARRKDLADLLVGVAGDFVPAREVLRPSFLLGLIGTGRVGAGAHGAEPGPVLPHTNL